ncbi:MAG: hypothetical protein IKB68_06395 [Rikenellaceae bacterium]|nr:hypothetical protein [Rikenellaceae bacterium]
MREAKNRQMLTTGIVDSNGNQIPPDVIDWSEFDLNPVLLYNPETEGHRGVVVGKVIDRERTGNGFSGRLAFVEGVAAADTAWEKYQQGALNFVSVGGLAAGEYVETEDGGKFVASQYLVKEVSLVKIPANLEAGKIEVREVAASDAWFTEGRSENEKVFSMHICCELKNVEETEIVETEIEASAETEVEASAETEETVEASAETEETVEVEASAETEETVEASAETEETVEASAETEETVEVEASAETEETVEVEASAETETEETVEASAETEVEASDNHVPMPASMSWHNRETLNKPNKNLMSKTFKQLNCDAEFQQRLNTLNAGFRHRATSADNTPENVETVQMLASAMLQDEQMVIIASATNFTDTTQGAPRRINGLKFLVECAAGGAAAATLAAADLGIIKWLSLFYERLLPNNTFMRSLRFVPMSDREGAVYIESGIDPATYIGSTTPVNAPHYLYDDIKRTIARQVFSIQPVTFQNADMAILAYDKQSLGRRTAMDALMSDVCTYILQVAATTPNIAKVGTSGATFNTANAFPLEAPNSALDVKGVAVTDLIATQGEFLKQNYKLDDRTVEYVLPAVLFSKLAAEPEILTNLTRDLEGTIRNELRFMGNRVSSRNPVARVNTANGNAELDPSLYAQGTVNPTTGAITSIVPAVTTANHVGAGLAFVENEIIAGIGTIDVIVAPDPVNYGITISGWMSAGATVAREDGKGVALIVPTEVE